MSIVMTLVIALKALNRNKMRTILTMLGMIIGVGAVITMVALGRGAQSTIEEQVKAAGTNMININAGNFSQGGVRQGQGNSTTLVADDAVAMRELPGVQYVAAGVNSSRAGHRREPELVDADSGHRSRLPVDPQLADQVRLVLHAAGRQQRVEGGGAGNGRLEHAVRTRTSIRRVRSSASEISPSRSSA